MTNEEKQLVERLRKHALEHYEENGWDYVVEAFDDADVLEAIDDARDFDAAVASLGELVGLLDERRKEVQSTAF